MNNIFYVIIIFFLVGLGALQYSSIRQTILLHQTIIAENVLDPATPSYAVPQLHQQPPTQLQASPPFSEASLRRIVRSELDRAADKTTAPPRREDEPTDKPPTTKSPEEIARLQRALDDALRDITRDGGFNARNSAAFDTILAQLPPAEQAQALAQLSGALSSE